MTDRAFRSLDASLADGPAARIPAARCGRCRHMIELDCLDARGFCADCAPIDADAELSADAEFGAWLDRRSAEALEAFERAVADEENSTDEALFAID